MDQTKTMFEDVVLIDGGLSTELLEMGYEIKGKYKSLWTAKWLVEEPLVLKRAHMNFLESGCEIIETSSYQLSGDILQRELNCDISQAKEYIEKTVRIADQARKETKKVNSLIAGSVGSYGACQCDCSEYDGSYAAKLTNEFLIEWHRPRIESLLEAKCDLLAIETIPSIKEAEAILQLLKNYPTAKAWLSFSCKDEMNICNGESFKEAYEKFKDNKQLVAIGINCTSPAYISGLLKSVDNQQLTLPFIVYTNYGSEWDGVEWTTKESKVSNTLMSNDTMMRDLMVEWINLGVKYIGGCCNFSSKHLSQMRHILEDLRK